MAAVARYNPLMVTVGAMAADASEEGPSPWDALWTGEGASPWQEHGTEGNLLRLEPSWSDYRVSSSDALWTGGNGFAGPKRKSNSGVWTVAKAARSGATERGLGEIHHLSGVREKPVRARGDKARYCRGDPTASPRAGEGPPCALMDLPAGRRRYTVYYGYPIFCSGPHIGFPPGVSACVGYVFVTARKCSRPKIYTTCGAVETLHCEQRSCQESRQIERYCANCGGQNSMEIKPGSLYLSEVCTAMPCPIADFCH